MLSSCRVATGLLWVAGLRTSYAFLRAAYWTLFPLCWAENQLMSYPQAANWAFAWLCWAANQLMSCPQAANWAFALVCWAANQLMSCPQAANWAFALFSWHRPREWTPTSFRKDRCVTGLLPVISLPLDSLSM